MGNLKNWYINKNKKTLGPYSQLQVEELISSGLFQLTDLAYPEDGANWNPIESYQEFNHLIDKKNNNSEIQEEDKTTLSFIAPPPSKAQLEKGEWYFLIKMLNGDSLQLKKLGPFEIEEAVKIIKTQPISMTDLVTGPGYYKWTPFALCRELISFSPPNEGENNLKNEEIQNNEPQSRLIRLNDVKNEFLKAEQMSLVAEDSVVSKLDKNKDEINQTKEKSNQGDENKSQREGSLPIIQIESEVSSSQKEDDEIEEKSIHYSGAFKIPKQEKPKKKKTKSQSGSQEKIKSKEDKLEKQKDKNTGTKIPLPSYYPHIQEEPGIASSRAVQAVLVLVFISVSAFVWDGFKSGWISEKMASLKDSSHEESEKREEIKKNQIKQLEEERNKKIRQEKSVKKIETVVDTKEEKKVAVQELPVKKEPPPPKIEFKTWQVELKEKRRSQLKVVISSDTGRILDKISYNVTLNTYAEDKLIELDPRTLTIPEGHYTLRVFENETLLATQKVSYITDELKFKSEMRNHRIKNSEKIKEEKDKLLASTNVLLDTIQAYNSHVGTIGPKGRVKLETTLKKANSSYFSQINKNENEVPYMYEWLWIQGHYKSLGQLIKNSKRAPSSQSEIETIESDLVKFKTQLEK